MREIVLVMRCMNAWKHKPIRELPTLLYVNIIDISAIILKLKCQKPENKFSTIDET